MVYDAVRGQNLLDLRRWADAEALARAAIAQDPGAATALHHLALALGEQGRLSAALSAAQSALSAAPQNPAILSTLTDLHLEMKDPVAAWQSATALVQLSPGWWVAHYDMARVLRLDPKQLLVAQQAADKAVELNPHSADAHNVRGIVLSDRNWNAEAEAAYRRALEIDPQHATAMNNLAALNLGSGGLRAAATQLSQSLAIDPFGAMPRQNLDTLMAEVVRRLSLCSLLVAVVLGVLIVSEVPYAVRAGVGALAFAAMGAFVWSVTSRVQAPTREVLRGIWKRWAGGHKYTVVVGLLVLGALGFVAFGSEGAAVLAVSLLVRMIPATLIVLAISWFQRRKRR